jgi:hypothetical protein
LDRRISNDLLARNIGIKTKFAIDDRIVFEEQVIGLPNRYGGFRQRAAMSGVKLLAYVISDYSPARNPAAGGSQRRLVYAVDESAIGNRQICRAIDKDAPRRHSKRIDLSDPVNRNPIDSLDRYSLS